MAAFTKRTHDVELSGVTGGRRIGDKRRLVSSSQIKKLEITLFLKLIRG